MLRRVIAALALVVVVIVGGQALLPAPLLLAAPAQPVLGAVVS